MRNLAAGLCLVSANALALGAGAGRSFANFDQFRVTHVDLNLDVDFGAQALRGSATLIVHRLDPAATHLVLDSRGLNVTDVDELTSDFLGATEQIAPIWVSRPFHGGPADPTLGRPLIIDLPASHAADETLRIQYETSAQAAGLHWPAPAPKQDRRADGGFFYALSEPIGARSWIPLQDTPNARVTLRAHIHTPDGLIALISGADAQKQRRAEDHWLVVSQPIAPNLIGLVVGDLKFKSLGPRAGVYADSGVARLAAADLAAAPAMLDAARELTGTRTAPRVDVVVMPSSFPIGDAALPGLILASPTLIGRGEAAASWFASGLAVAADPAPVGIADWQDRWIGRAFAGYLQSRIVRIVYGEPRAAFDDAVAAMSLRDALAHSLPADQVLAADAGDAAAPTADSAPRVIAREKGKLFFDFLDNRFGRERFDGFVRGYFERFAGRSVATGEFLDYLQQNLLDRFPGGVKRAAVDAWVFQPGIPTDAIWPRTDVLEPLDRQRSAWLAGHVAAEALDARRWSSAEWAYFLSRLPKGLDPARLAALDKAYDLTRSRDAPLESLWLRLAVGGGYDAALPRLEQYLQAVGRVRLIEPLYAALLQTPAGTALAQRVYTLARPGYDRTAAQALDALVKH